MVMKGTISRGRTYHILRSTNKRVRIQASRLVAMAWIPNPENKPFVCHKDNVPTNNHYKNLYWGTQKENMEQCIKDKWTDGLALEISHNGWQTISIGNLDLEDLKRIRKVIRKAIREHENNKSV